MHIWTSLVILSNIKWSTPIFSHKDMLEGKALYPNKEKVRNFIQN